MVNPHIPFDEVAEAETRLAQEILPMPFEMEGFGPVRRIAVFRALTLGDLMVAVPAFRALRAAFPDAEITHIGLPWARVFAERYPRLIDRFVEFAGYPGLNEVPVDPECTRRFLDEQRACDYDLVIQMHDSGQQSTPFALALGGRVTVGYHSGVPARGLTLSAPYPDSAHEIERNLGLVRLLGLPADDTRLEFPTWLHERVQAARLLKPIEEGGTLVVGMHAGASVPARRWPAEYFAQVANTLAMRYGARTVLTGGPGEEHITRTVAAHAQTRVLNLSGKTSLGVLGAVIGRLDVFLTNDTGPSHIAHAVGTPTVTLFGPVDPARWGPLDRSRHVVLRRSVHCSPCNLTECPIDHRCLRWLTPDRVISTLDSLLARRKAA